MKAVILAGGYGTRLMEETQAIPKPLVPIGGKPIIWHIMKLLSFYGINECIICCGYKGYLIKEYFANYFLHMSDVTFDMKTNKMKVHEKHSEHWKVTLVDTGEKTNTGGRLKRVAGYLDKAPFIFTYGDGIGDVNIKSLVNFAKKHDKLACVTAVQPPGRYGLLDIDGDYVSNFVEKPEGDGSWINGGFFVLKPEVVHYIENDETIWEQQPLVRLSKEGQLVAYKHYGFWRPMDTLRDKIHLEELWSSGKAPWKLWE
ncbi:MAG: glucose-1-phosphate cytidylyltransferase [Candidatus Nanoarchaeia archaeon]